ncbi:MAG TPA: gamma-glutamyltransferase, partial [Thermoleophilia bacterium]|nr:gamma-glutamyltransferase [Thermoleophilia bacterium]
LIGTHAGPAPQAGQLPGYARAADATREAAGTSHFVVMDTAGNVVSMTTTVESVFGSGRMVDGFVLNNQLTDFSFVPRDQHGLVANRVQGGKRPRSSMAPTIVLREGRPFLAVGSPGGASIITTVLQILFDRLDLAMSLPDAIAAPRISQRDSSATQAESAFLASPLDPALTKLGQSFVPAPPVFTAAPEIGAATGLEFLGHGQVLAAAEPTRRFGGSAMVVDPGR